MAEYRTVEAEALEGLGRRVFVALGAPDEIAAEVAAHLVRANLAGHDSHGVIRIPQYATMIEQGTIRPDGRPAVTTRRGATMLVDAGDGFGQFATAWALDQAIDLAGSQGAAVVSIRRINHIGRLGDYTERAALRGYVAQVTVGAAGPGIGGATPFGGAARFLGTNPWSLGIPTGADPVVVDFATTVVAEGKVRVARAKREALPPGCIVDKEGRPSTDPEDFYAGGMLLPFGGHKGYGLALGAALLGGLAAIGEGDPSMAGAAAPPAERGQGDRTAGVFMVVVDPAAFGDAGEYVANVGRVTTSLKAVAPAPGVAGVLLPGEPEVRTRRERLDQGIAIPEDTWEAIARVAGGCGVEMPPAR